jgi:hypothetical protein
MTQSPLPVEAPSRELGASRIRTKVNVACELVLTDGTRLTGSVFIGLGERVQDLLNNGAAFFPFRQDDQEILLVNKTVVAICKPLDAAR